MIQIVNCIYIIYKTTHKASTYSKWQQCVMNEQTIYAIRWKNRRTWLSFCKVVSDWMSRGNLRQFTTEYNDFPL